jgi:phage terminase large subunit-like protein
MNKKALEKVIDGTPQERHFLCEHSFGLFAVYYFSNYFKYALAPYHYDMVQDLHDLLDGKIRECAWIMYRESAKTTFAKLFIIWCIAYKKKKYINVDSFDKENAERILFDVAFELTNNKKLQADFPTLFSKRRGIEDIKQNRINNFVTENGIRVEAHSTQESVRGRIHLDQRPDMLIADDIETNKTKESEAYTKQVRDHISEALAGMAPDGKILYLCNYITESGNVQFLIDRAVNDHKLRVRNVPVMTDNIPAWPSKYALTDEEAEKTGKVSIEDKQRQLGSLVFSYEMMNQPIDEMLAEFKKEYVQLEAEQDVNKLDHVVYITIDSAVSEKESADFTGVTINRVSSDNKWFVTTYRLKINSKELIDHIFYLHKSYSPVFIGLEETTFTMAIQPFLQDEMRKRGIFMTITPVKHRGTNKETRIRGLIPRWESRSIFLVGNNTELLDEMRTFPNGQNDDVLDSLAMQLQHAQAPASMRDQLLMQEHESQRVEHAASRYGL